MLWLLLGFARPILLSAAVLVAHIECHTHTLNCALGPLVSGLAQAIHATSSCIGQLLARRSPDIPFSHHWPASRQHIRSPMNSSITAARSAHGRPDVNQYFPFPHSVPGQRRGGRGGRYHGTGICFITVTRLRNKCSR
jgi:hypothetical protein